MISGLVVTLALSSTLMVCTGQSIPLLILVTPELRLASILITSPENRQISCVPAADSVVPNRGTIYHSLLYTNGQWAVQDSSWEYYDDVTGYWVSPAGTWYVGTSAGLFKMQGSNLIPVLDQEMWVWGLHGTSDNNIYITAKRYDTFYVMHYNGSDWHTYDALTRTEDQQVIADVFAIDGEVFVTGYTNGAWPQKSIIFHGK